MTSPRVNGAHRVYAGRNRSWHRVWLAPALAAVVALAAAGVFVATRPSAQPEPVSAAAGARTAATPTAPQTPRTPYPGLNVDEDGPADTTTKGCAP